MAEKTPAQTIINSEADSTLQKIYASDLQTVPVSTGNATIYITNTQEYVTNYISTPGKPSGNSTEVQFNQNGVMAGDNGMTYDAATDSLHITGNITAGKLKTDYLLYANGDPYSTGGSSYGNSNVALFLASYTGNLTANNANATRFNGSGAGLTNIPAGNISGPVAFATVANSVAGANVSGTVANATYATSAGTATSATSATTAGTATSATSATTAGTVTTAAQPNITSVGTLSSLTVSGTLTGNLTGSANTVTTNAQPNITSVGSLTGLTVSNATGVVNFTTTANVTLGAVSNLHISGGTSGYVLSTNGSGALSWVAQSGGATPNLYAVTNSGNTTNVAVHITNTTVSTAYNNGSFIVDGGIGIGGNIHTNGHIAANSTIYAGHYSDLGSWTNPIFIGKDAGADYVQGALVNGTSTGSADWIAYNDLSDGDGGESAWSDMGYCGSTFNDANYTITEANDGYFFVQGIDALAGGNLVIATGGKGLNHDIVFATGGFLSANEKFRYVHADDALIPHANKTMDLGNNTHRFDNVYANVVTATNIGNIASLNLDGNVSNVLAGDGTWIAAGGGGSSYGDSNVSTLLGSFGSNNIVTTGNVQAKNIRANASHANLVFGDATSSSGPGMSSTDTMAIVTNRGTSDKAWYFNTDGSLSVPGHIIPSANVTYNLGSPTARFNDLYLAGTTIYIGGSSISVDANTGDITMGNLSISGDGSISGDSITGNLTTLAVTGTTNLGAVGNLHISGGANGQVLSTDGAGNLYWDTVSGGGGVPAGSGTTAYSDVWVLSVKGSDAGFWTSYSLTGNLAALYGGADVTGLSSQTVYGKQVASGSKTLVVNNAVIQSNSYGIVIEFPASPSVGDTFSSPITGGTSVSKLIFKPASGQKGYTMSGGGGSSTAFGSGTSYIGMYVDISSMGSQPITWVYAGSISGTPTWYQMYF